MIKLRTIIILLIVYVLSYISLNYDINLLYPYYYIKNILLYPVYALSIDSDIELSSNYQESIISSLKEEIEELKKINNITNVLSDFNYINATIVDRNREYWFNTLTINKGSSDGIKEDMAVVDSNGLIGRVSDVNLNFSIIKLITTNDVKNKISVVIKNNDKDVYGIMSGYDTRFNLLKVIINENIDIYDKSIVMTTGMGGIFPRGILIGEVFDTMNGDDAVTIIVRVRPYANIKGEKYVSVLQRKDSI